MFKKNKNTGFVENLGEDFEVYLQQKKIVKANLATKKKLQNTEQEMSNMKAELAVIKELLGVK